MNADELRALGEALDDLLGDRNDPSGSGYDGDLWSLLQQAGLTTIGITEDAGGSGGSLAAAVLVARKAGEHAVRVPLAESALVGGWLLATAGRPLPTGPVAASHRPLDGDRLRRVPYAAVADVVAVLTADGAVAPLQGAETVPGRNLAGEPRDDVLVPRTGGVQVAVGTADELRLRAALASAAQTAGALVRVQRMTVTYALQREQFGRPIARFQAVQHQVATLVCEVVATTAAVDGAVRTWEANGPAAAAFAVGAAKVRSAQAATVVAGVAHQVHGAIGTTDEHPLRAWTTRLWSWRSEVDGERAWSERLAVAAIAAGPAGTWPLLTSA